jgi:hypothetical protein
MELSILLQAKGVRAWLIRRTIHFSSENRGFDLQALTAKPQLWSDKRQFD